MSLFVPPVLPQVQPNTAAQGLAQQNQAPNAVQVAAAVTAVPVGNQTRMAAVASGNSGGAAQAKGDKGKKTDNNASATEAKTETRGAHPRNMGRQTDLSV